MPTTVPPDLTLTRLRKAIDDPASAFRSITEYQPAGGPGDKVFPPTYSGGIYAVETRRIDGEEVPCVLLDSVQSQANRMELALLEAWESQRIPLPVISVDFSDSGLLEVGRNWRITSLEAPHRIADAILRDSLVETGEPFSKSDYARAWGASRAHNATALFRLCPTALIFGTWGSPEKPGGMGAKFARALVSEMIGLHFVPGVKTSSRIDPLGIRAGAATLYKAKDGTGIDWTPDADEAVEEKGKPITLGKTGRPSEANHGNVTPGFAKYLKGAEGPDPLKVPEVEVDYRLRGRNGQIDSYNRMRSTSPQARQGDIAPGGVTLSRAVQTTVLSLPALRRLRFPLKNHKKSDPKTDLAARTALAALALCGAALLQEQGCDLRSRCMLVPSQTIRWELLDQPGEAPTPFSLSAKVAVELCSQAVGEAKKAKLPWLEKEIVLTPSPQLVTLVQRSQELTTKVGEEETEVA